LALRGWAILKIYAGWINTHYVQKYQKPVFIDANFFFKLLKQQVFTVDGGALQSHFWANSTAIQGKIHRRQSPKLI